VVTSAPGFANEAGQEFGLATTSPNVNAGGVLAPDPLPEPGLSREYVKHQSNKVRPNDGVLDIGAFEMEDGQPADLVLATNSVPAGTVGTSYRAAFAATGGIPPYSWSQAGGTLPPGLSIGATTGDIAGTPSSAGTWSFNVQVSDSQVPADTATRAFTVAIAAAPQPTPVTITTTSLPYAKRNKNYSRTLTASGGKTPYAWSLAAGSLPPGLKIAASTGVISGKATTLGTFSFTVRVTDSQSAAVTATKALSIAVVR
jgi:hypothetical protein